MFPISDSIKSARFPLFNFIFIAVTVYVFYLQLTVPDPDGFLSQYALIPSLVNFSNPNTLFPFITAMFLHGGFLHIISNMVFLYVFGDNVEGHLPFLVYPVLYFTAGIVGNITQYMLMPTASVPMIGASGAVAGALGAYWILFPGAKIKTIVPFFGFITFLNIRASLMLGYWFILQIFSGFGTLSQNANQGGVAFWAHIGGFVVGIVFAKVFARKEATRNVIEGEIIE